MKCITNQGSISKVTLRNYIDQIDPNHPPWIGPKNQLIPRILKLYNLTESEYINIIIRGDKDSYRICNNPACNGNIHEHLPCSPKLSCSLSCRTASSNLKLSAVGNHNTQLRIKAGTHTFQVDNPVHKSVIEGSHNFQTTYEWQRSNRYLADRNKFINQFESRNLSAYFYLTGNNQGLIKFGITTSGHYRKYNRNKNPSVGFYKTIHMIRSGSIVDIAELEYQIKLKMNPWELGSTEIIPISRLKELIKIIKSNK